MVVADKKTPHNEWISFLADGLHFISLADQHKKYPVLSKLIGENSYSRKNIGYLYATEQGAEVIFDTDDDTFLRAEALDLFTGKKEFEHFGVTGDGWFNPYILFAPNSGLWPRGYPLSKIASDRWRLNPNLKISSLEKIKPEILQTLVNLEPDVDSIYRLTVSEEILEFPTSDAIFHINRPVMTTANTQSTFWLNRSTFSYLYIPTTVSFRFTDILKMFIAQSEVKISYSGFLTEQFRNPHDFMQDFASEIQLFMQTPEVVKKLLENRFSSLIEVYVSLEENSVCEPREIDIVGEFVSAMRRLIAI